MKFIITFILLLTATFFYAQDGNPEKSKNTIGFNLTYDGYNGLTNELLYDKQIGKGFYIRGALLSSYNPLFSDNSKSFNRFKLGIHKTIFDLKHFDVDVGVNLSSTHYDFSTLGSGKGQYFGSEVVLQLRYHLSPSIDLNIGGTFSKARNFPINSDNKAINLGLYKRF